MKAIGFAGYSGSGKTTLIERLLPMFRADGLRVAVIKQSHHDVEVDTPGKDSWRHRKAGANEVLLTSSHRWMLVHELREETEPDLAAHLARLSPCDLVLVEGFRHADLPKLEVWREANQRPWLHPNDPHILAAVSDLPPPGIRHLPIDAPQGVHQFILEHLQLK
jgi:molybdopterin-guanine dinucleotide biosynthesis protein B